MKIESQTLKINAYCYENSEDVTLLDNLDTLHKLLVEGWKIVATVTIDSKPHHCILYTLTKETIQEPKWRK